MLLARLMSASGLRDVVRADAEEARERTVRRWFFIVLAATLSAVGHVPVAGLALILGIDRFMSEARALTNLIGNGVATIVVAKWTNDLDTARLQAQLDNESAMDADEPEAVADRVDAHLPTAR